MARRSTSTDPRAQRARQAIRRAAMDLAAREPVDSMTLARLLEEAGVSRQGFYEHFRDRDEALLAAITMDFQAGVEEPCRSARDVQEMLDILTAYVDVHRPMYLNLRSSAVFEDVVEMWRELFLPHCRDIAARAIEVRGEYLDDSDREALTRFVLGGLVELIRTWLREGDRSVSPATEAGVIARQLERFLGLPAA
ncbi:TetR/AcrR family transcriptional regulator [Cellulomonas endometrii]|uniref:TetR/AcrR family transcriptional regulator n=1 Tax=Cellulomonas endometrii TaxID=3036301 RepID=UPI0024AD659E|nr:TetR/AcrR family transcriptional regulator [Cellulomonas endometrii]